MSEKTNLPEIIKDRKKLTKTAKQRIINAIFWNCIFVIVMLLICFGLNITFNKINLVNFERVMKIVPMVLAVFTILLFEISYRKDSGIVAIYAVEAAIFSIAILFVPYLVIAQNKIMYLADISKIVVIYYGAKCIVSFLTIRYKDLDENMSDVKELVAYNERKSYIDEESSKTLKEAKELKYLADERRKKEKELNIARIHEEENEKDNIEDIKEIKKEVKKETSKESTKRVDKKQVKKPKHAVDNSKDSKKTSKTKKQEQKIETNQTKKIEPKPKRRITGKK